jgi:hypothetical protein
MSNNILYGGIDDEYTCRCIQGRVFIQLDDLKKLCMNINYIRLDNHIVSNTEMVIGIITNNG